MSEIGAVVRTDAPGPAEARQVPDRDRGKRQQPRRPRTDEDERDVTAAEPRKLDVQA
jgi:hypothetical protein